jgi:AcrR family transcriptional regulator
MVMAIGNKVRVQKRQQQTRAKLLRAGYKLISSGGVDATSIQEVTDSADVGFGTFYNYFKSKEELAEGILDCVIYNLGCRNHLANSKAGVTAPLTVIANSVRLSLRETRNDPMWRWWLKRTDLMVRRMKLVFMPFGFADVTTAIDAGLLQVPHDDLPIAWGYLIWLIAGTMTDFAEENLPLTRERRMAEFILRALGAEPALAEAAAKSKLPALPKLAIDFSFRLDSMDEAT